MARETLIRPMGLITQPNQLGAYPAGAFKRADNVVMRAPGEVAQIQTVSQYAAPYASAGSRPLRLFSTGKQLLSWNENAGTWSTIWLNGTAPIAATYRDTSVTAGYNASNITPITFRGRVLVNAYDGIKVADYLDPTTTAEREFRDAQLPQPIIQGWSLPSAGQALPTQHVRSYAAVIRRKYADGYELMGPPSPIQRIKNPSVTATVVWILVRWTGSVAGRGGVRAGDIVELYASTSVNSPGNDLNTESGAQLYLVSSYTVPNDSDQAATLIDDSSPTSLGPVELYTNPGQIPYGALNANFQPPRAKVVTQFKGHAFYFNITEPAAWKAAWPNGLGSLPAGTPRRASGIGWRHPTGTFTNGSPVVTGISAADMVGVVAGQFLWTLGFTILSVTASTITLTDPWPFASSTFAFDVFDVLEIDGTTYPIGDLELLFYALHLNSGFRWYTMVTQETLTYREAYTAGSYGLTHTQGLKIEPYRGVQGSLTIRGTNGANYVPAIPELSTDQPAKEFNPTERKNGYRYSADQQPEACPVPFEGHVGGGEVYGAWSTRDAIWVFASDGLTRISGQGGKKPNWQQDPFDSTIALSAPMAGCVLRDSVYAYTSRGLVRVNNAGVVELTTGVLGNVLIGPAWSGTNDIFVESDENNNEVWLGIRADGVTAQYWVYNVDQAAMTKYIARPLSTAIAYATFLGGVAITDLVAAGLSGGVYWFDPTNDVASESTVDFQPTYGENPVSVKQWSTMMVIFDRDSAGRSVTPRYNEVAKTARTLTQLSNDARTNFGIGRAAPAVSNMLAPGLVMSAGASRMKLSGVSLRFSELTEQQVKR